LPILLNISVLPFIEKNIYRSIVINPKIDAGKNAIYAFSAQAIPVDSYFIASTYNERSYSLPSLGNVPSKLKTENSDC